MDCNNVTDEDDIEVEKNPKRLLRRQVVQSKKFCAKDERNASLKKVSIILQKCATDRTCEETQMLTECVEAVEEVQLRWRKRDEAKRRLEEYEEPYDILRQKCQILAQAVAQSQHLVVYTGAGISTAAKIPDYRGPNGIWTRLQQGKDIGDHDLSSAEPTFTHMALAELYHRNILKYVVSQNCDGLHLRSGLPRIAISELHGNMYIEICKQCKPHREYWRLFDVTENTARYSHKTQRKCYICNSPLLDTIVHFGERGNLQWPLNWSGAIKNAEKATTILCLGSSLKVLKKYPWLWQMDKPVKKRPNLYIVNLQWTPKDDCANIKINGKCDLVMELLMNILDIKVNKYNKFSDPIFAHFTPLCDLELHTTAQPILKCDDDDNKDCLDLKNIKEICDKSSNTSTNGLPQQSINFSIDNILQNNYQQQQQQNFFNFFQYFSTDFLLYPYQTSFLYSGLHNIINPNMKQEYHTKEEVKCEFCFKHYKSFYCLFYQKLPSVFLNKQFRFSKIDKTSKPNCCVCCDYSTDEENEQTIDNENQLKINNNKIQAGWFGKGYRKNRRIKKK